VGLWKTKITIWSSRDPQNLSLAHLAQDATDGCSKCSKCHSEHVSDPEKDPDFEGVGEFFDLELSEEGR